MSVVFCCIQVMVGCLVSGRVGVEDTRLEAKAKDTKKSEAKYSPSEDRLSRGQEQECSRPRSKTKDTGASVLGEKKFFWAISKKKVFKKIFASARVT